MGGALERAQLSDPHAHPLSACAGPACPRPSLSSFYFAAFSVLRLPAEDAAYQSFSAIITVANPPVSTTVSGPNYIVPNGTNKLSIDTGEASLTHSHFFIVTHVEVRK